MYDPIIDLLSERQRQMRQEAETHHRLAAIRTPHPGLRQRAYYTLGGVLISFGTRLREDAKGQYVPAKPAASYGMTEGCS